MTTPEFRISELALKDISLSVQVCEPFNMIIDYKSCPTDWRWRESNSRPYQTNNPYDYMLIVLNIVPFRRKTPRKKRTHPLLSRIRPKRCDEKALFTPG